MFKIFDRNHKQIDILENPYNAIITDELNGIGELKFTVPITYKKLQLEGYVQVKDGHEYVIKEITTEGRERNVHCVLNIEELLGMVHTTFTSKENNLNDTMKIILNGTTWTHVNNSTRKYTRNLYGTVVSSYHMLQLMSTVFDVEFYFDTHKKIVYIVDRVGEDNGTYFINDLNLKQLSQDTHTHNLITRVIPLGKDNLNISEVNGGRMWLENHTYSNKIIYGVWQATDYDNATKLKEDAQRYLNEMAIPYESYEIQVTDISKLANNPDFKYELGDVITIIDNLTETRIKQRIYRKVYNLQDPDADIINIASKDKTFEDYYKRMQTVADMTDKVINTDGTINSEAIDKVPADKIVGDILATGIKADSITADHIKAGQIQAKHITADAISANHIKANSIQTKHLQANSITSGHIQADTITSSHIQTGAITAGSGIIADGAIGNAQISNLDASKLTAGTIDTSDITIAGANQNLRITGNRLQVFEGVGNKQKERVSLGDVNADGSVYGIRVRGRDGTTVLFDDNGVTKEGITNGSITNDKINPSANIDGSKLNINSVINRINSDGSTNIQGNRISIDNKSLSSVISEINTKNTAQDKSISSQASSITANTNAIKLKVDTQTYTTDKTNMTSKLDKATSEISTMKNQIALKVEQTHINNAVNSLNNTIDSKISSAKSEIKATTDSITNRVSKTETNITNVTNDLNKLQVGGRNFVLNGGFAGSVPNATAPPKWTRWSENIKVYGNQGTGNYTKPNTVYLANASTSSGGIYQDISSSLVPPNTQITISGTLTKENNVVSTKLSIEYFDSSNNKLGNVDIGMGNIKKTITTASSYSKLRVVIHHGGSNSSSSGYLIMATGIKLEKGNKATDFSPAPEDIQSQIDTNKTNISTTTNKVSEIQTNLNGITSRVSSVETKATTLEGKVTSHDNRIKTAESKITDSAIINTVSSTIDSKVNTGISNIKLGGRNLIQNSAPDTNSGWSPSANWTLSVVNCNTAPNKKAIRVTNSNNATSGGVHKPPIDGKGRLIDGETYTISAWIRASKSCKATFYNETMKSSNIIDVTTSWKFYKFTSAININTAYHSDILYVTSATIANGMWLEIHSLQLEKGSKTTDWTPAPEDIKSDVSSLTTRVETAESKLTKNSLTTTIGNYYTTPSDVNSSITSKGYQTSSQVQQTVNALQVKFNQSGGSNMLYNSNFANKGMDKWMFVNGGSQWTDMSSKYYDEEGCMCIICKDTTNFHFGQDVRNVKANTKYTFSVKLKKEAKVKGARLYLDFYDSSGSWIKGETHPNYSFTGKREYVTFTTPANTVRMNMFIEHLGSTGSNADSTIVKLYRPCLTEGETHVGWTPHPNEVYDGITKIDRDGITVKNTSANTYTQIDTGSFSVNNNNGATIAEFSQNSNIPILTAGNITANIVKANNLATSSGNKSWSGRTYYVQGTTGVDAEGRGTSWGNAFRSVQYVLDNYIEDILNDNVSIHVGSSVQGWNCYGRSGRGTLQFYLENDAVVSTEVVIQGCTNFVRVVGTNDRKGTLKKGIVAHNCSFVDVGWVTFRGENWWHASGSCNVVFSDFTRGIVRMCDLNGVSYGVIADLGSHMWLYNNKGSNITNYVGIGAYTRISTTRSGSDTCPDYSGYMYGNANHANLYIIEDGATFTKTPSVGWSPSYTPTKRTSTWNFNKIWSDETLHGWSDRNELIQGYSSAYDTGRWTGYLQMTDGMSAIRNTISGGTNLSGRVYVQRRTSSGAGTGTCCMYASDGTHIANISMARGAGAWFTLNSSVVSKIMNGSITYFYLKNDSNNINTYMKMETLGKIEITYTK